jgi:hypothetical protein
MVVEAAFQAERTFALIMTLLLDVSRKYSGSADQIHPWLCHRMDSENEISDVPQDQVLQRLVLLAYPCATETLIWSAIPSLHFDTDPAVLH